jgi:hypothetical protein
MGRLSLVIVWSIAAIVSAGAARGQNILCSAVTSVISYGQFTCVPLYTFSVNVNFTVTDQYTQPYTKSQTKYVSYGIVQLGGTGYCTLPGMSDYLPPAAYTVKLQGSGSNYNTYQQVWQGSETNYGTLYGLPVKTGTTLTSPISISAKGCCS